LANVIEKANRPGKDVLPTRFINARERQEISYAG
jgi:hypothetical protein